jgi:hypothetical protein
VAICQGAAVVNGGVPHERTVGYRTDAAPAVYRTAIAIRPKIADECAVVDHGSEKTVAVAADTSPALKSAVVANDAVTDGRVGFPASNSCITVARNDAICNRRAAAAAVYPPTDALIPIRDCKAGKDRIAVFAVLENESAVRIVCIGVAVNYRCSDKARVLGKKALDSDGLAQKIDVPVAGPCICAGEDIDKVAIVGFVNCRLNVVEIGHAVIVDDEYLRLTGNGHKQAKKQGTGYNPHFEILQVKAQSNPILTEKRLCLQGIFLPFSIVILELPAKGTRPSPIETNEQGPARKEIWIFFTLTVHFALSLRENAQKLTNRDHGAQSLSSNPPK